ncbi:family 15 carbohydrate esterase [Cryphonectria parasitica EP155]|uniref:(4-O-methyl)-D-glucuronate--lignin esterase n=1 Tax=Cryphonectria parasitica (strain ATCC 38755 / EP155) TaxID=660469 RepID=A0A9P4Y9C6_CRYP1|nr:family 15 carbohydrate esterase [Cryphonectria parasitica EP155]KAF3769156.1 family 15 carbohydrate esterase [Cryphonectria parasitica EP155]
MFSTKVWLPLLLLAGSSLALPEPDHIELVPRQSSSATCSVASSYPTVSVASLPDPFITAAGQNVTTKAEFDCRAQEISKIFQQYELGDYPGPADSVKGTLSGNTLTVAVTVGSNSVSYTASISKPSGNGPFPAFITIGGASIPIPAGVATVNFNNDDFAAEDSPSSHGVGKFFTLFGANHSAGALTAWAWGVDRLIDALEQVNATSGIDTSRLGVTGCSRDGKGAFITGALVKRIVLTVPQESGSGGAACWRISDSQFAAGANIQTAHEIVTENAWFSPRFNAYVNETSSIPEDHHMLAALIVPRGLFVIENDIDWLGPVSTTGCMEAGRVIYKAYGVPDNFGFSLVGNHAHCAFPSAQTTDLDTYINYFLLNSSTAPGDIQVSSSQVNLSQWDGTWNVPTLT